MISAMSGSLTLLRQRDNTQSSSDAADNILNIVNKSKSGASTVEDGMAQKVADSSDRALDRSEPEFPKPPPGSNVIDIDDPSLPEEIKKVSAQLKVRHHEYNSIEKYNDLLHEFSRKNTVADLNFHSHVVQATTLSESAADSWERQLDNANYHTGSAVGALAEANAKFHPLTPVDINRKDVNEDAIKFVNDIIKLDNKIHEQLTGEVIVSRLAIIDQNGLADKIKRVDGGYKLSAYEIKSDDGRLVAEMKDTSHYITYNMDGSVRREMNRADVTRELGSQVSMFSRMAGVLYDDEKDFEFY